MWPAQLSETTDEEYWINCIRIWLNITGIQPFLGYLWANEKYNTQHLARLFLLFLFILIVHRATKILLRAILRTFPRGWGFDIHIRIIVLVMY